MWKAGPKVEDGGRYDENEKVIMGLSGVWIEVVCTAVVEACEAGFSYRGCGIVPSWAMAPR